VRADLTISPRVHACRGFVDNETLSATTDIFGVDLRIGKAWDLPAVTLDLGVTAGGELLYERFETRGRAPNRLSPAGHVDAGLGVVVPIAGRLYLTGEAAVQTHFFIVEDQDGVKDLSSRFALRGFVAVGAWH
jgi:hypothetical protein